MLKKGDKVRVTNVKNIIHGEKFFNEGDESVVQATDSIFGIPAVFVTVTKNHDDPGIVSRGVDHNALGFTPNEVQFLVKIEEEN